MKVVSSHLEQLSMQQLHETVHLQSGLVIVFSWIPGLKKIHGAQHIPNYCQYSGKNENLSVVTMMPQDCHYLNG